MKGNRLITLVSLRFYNPVLNLISQFQKLCDIRIKEVDQILAKAKQDLGA